MMTSAESLAFLRTRMLGGTTMAVDPFPDDDMPGFVFAVRTPGKSARSFSLVASPVCGLVVTELQPGCRILTSIDNAKWKTTQPSGDAR